jgi:hypothetical protein
MRIIEIQEGICINADHIDGIKEKNDGTCEVYCGQKTYISTYPYQTLMDMLKMEDMVDKGTSKDDAMLDTMKKVEQALNKTQYFSG